MSIATYAELKTAVADFMNVAEADASIDTFIKLTESQFERELRVREQEKSASYLINDTDLSLPADFLEIKSITLDGTGRRLDFVSQDSLMNHQSLTASPKLFTVFGEFIKVWPQPASGSDVAATLLYYARLDPLSASAPTNSILTNYPDLYMYGCLTNAAGYLKDDASLGIYAPLYERAVRAANSNDKRKIGQRLRMRPSGAPV